MAGMQQLTLVSASCETLELVVAGEGRGVGEEEEVVVVAVVKKQVY